VKLQAANSPVARYVCIVVLIACQTQVSEIRTRVISGFVQRTKQDFFKVWSYWKTTGHRMILLKHAWTVFFLWSGH